MERKLLEALRVVVSNKSVTKAAEILGVTQPAVSAQIGRLEAMIGFQLFERRHGKLTLTGEGRQFYSEVPHSLEVLDRLERVADGIRQGSVGEVVVASHPSASISLLPDLAAEFRRSHPDVRLRMLNRSSEEVRSFFPDSSIDIGVAELPIDIGGINLSRHVVRTVAILPPGHPAAACEMVTPADLSGHPFIALAPERIIAHRIRESFSQAGATLNLVAETDFFSVCCAAVAAGGCASIVDAWSARTFRPLGLEVRPFAPVIPYEIGILTSASRPASKPAQAFVKLLEQKLKESADDRQA